MSLYGDILQENFFDLKNSKNRQINGDLEPLKGFGINFFGSYHSMKTPQKPCLNSWHGSAQLSPASPSPPSAEFCTNEDNSVSRSAMDAFRYSKK